MPVWKSGGVGPLAPEVLSQSSVELQPRETGWLYMHNFELPEEAFFAFENENDEEVFIGRTVIGGDLVPGMIIPTAETVLITNKGTVGNQDDKQVLCGIHMKWEEFDPGILHRAVIGGRLANGEPFYIGWANIDGKSLIGRVDPTQNCQLFVPVNGTEVALSTYSILIQGV